MKRVIVLALMLLVATTTTACAKIPGEAAPQFKLNDLEGNEISLAEVVQSKPVLLDFWATWCPPCRKEAPLVQAFYDKYQGQVAVIGVNVNESPKAITSFMTELGLNYPVVIDSTGVAQEYGVVGIPTIVLVARGGEIVYFGHSVHEAEEHLSEAGL